MDRRVFFGSLAVSLGAVPFFTVPGAFAEQLALTPKLTEGPFYPDKLPLDQDNDLIIINNSITPAIGEVTHLTGRVLSATGEPIKDAVVEIWHCDANAVYLHTRDSGPKKAQQDKNFQGFGRFQTDAKGNYRFRTIKPVPYPGRPAPHVHFKVKKGDRELLTSQFFINGHAGNKKDFIFQAVRNPLLRELLSADFKPMKGSKIGELTAEYDIVVGVMPDESRERKK